MLRNDSTSVTSESSARTEARRGPVSTTRLPQPARTSARLRRASRAEWGLSHQRSRPMTDRGAELRQSRAHHSRVVQVTASAPTAARPAGGSPASQRSKPDTEGLPSWTNRAISATRVRTASSGARDSPATRDRRAASPSARRAVRADQAKESRSSDPRAVGAQGQTDRVVGHPEGSTPGPPDRQSGQRVAGVGQR